MSKIRQRDFDYDPVLFLRCHSKTDREYADVKTQIWQACFEPVKKSKIVATCGGNQICLIDVKTNEIEQRYTADSREIFYALAWGFVAHETLSEAVPILAAAGVRNTIYFVCPQRKILLRKFTFKIPKIRTSSYITSLLFHPKEKNILFCSTNIGKIYILRLHVDEELMLRITKINEFACDSEIYSLVYCKGQNMLLAATDAGLIGWFITNYEKEMMDDFIRFRLPRNLKNAESHGFDLVDSVEIIKNNLIAVKCALHGFIYICCLDHVQEKYRDSCIVELPALYSLKWSSTDNYFMGINVNYEKGLLSCGDDKGAIWLYDIDFLKNIDIPMEPETVDPVKVIEWPTVEDKSLTKSRKLNLETYDIVVAKATIHANGKYIVAITNNNTVCIWKLTSKH